MKFTAKKKANLLDLIMETHSGISRQKAKKMIMYNEFLVNGTLIDKHPMFEVQEGAIVEICKSSNKEKNTPRPTKTNPVSIFFEDQYFVVALKPAGVLSCGDKLQKNFTTFHKLLEDYINRDLEKKIRLWVVHRLDKEVEGLILFAKSEEIQIKIKENWNEVTKKYLALVESKPPQEEGVIESWLKEGYEQRIFSYNKEVDGSKFAKTQYKYLRKERGYHLIELLLHTGRKNQIRAQLASIKCPIVGDRKYGADDSFVRQIRLAAYWLEFENPYTGKKVVLNYMPSQKFFSPSTNSDEKYKVIVKRRKKD